MRLCDFVTLSPATQDETLPETVVPVCRGRMRRKSKNNTSIS